jgi:hypothetical protein
VIYTSTSDETSPSTLQARETIEQPCSDVVTHILEVCKGTHLYNGYPTIKDDNDSWGICTTSAECQSITTVVLTITSGMDPHMISGNLGWVWFAWVSSGLYCWLGRSPTVDSVV